MSEPRTYVEWRCPNGCTVVPNPVDREKVEAMPCFRCGGLVRHLTVVPLNDVLALLRDRAAALLRHGQHHVADCPVCQGTGQKDGEAEMGDCRCSENVVALDCHEHSGADDPLPFACHDCLRPVSGPGPCSYCGGSGRSVMIAPDSLRAKLERVIAANEDAVRMARDLLSALTEAARGESGEGLALPGDAA